MDEQAREARRRADLAALEALQAASSILAFRPVGEPPTRYWVRFRGHGLCRESATGRVEPVGEHECEIRLTGSYPQQPPDIRWRTPLLHPNIAFGGVVHLADIGMAWTENLTLGVVCERLWDVARLAWYDLETATNSAAKRWLEEHPEQRLPTDPRPLRDRAGRANRNVIRYRRRGAREVVLAEDKSQAEDILYIDEDTPVPTLPTAPRRSPPQNDDVLYIGGE